MKRKPGDKPSIRRGTTKPPSRVKKPSSSRVLAKTTPPIAKPIAARVDPAPEPAHAVPAPGPSFRPTSVGEPQGMLDYEELPETYGVNEVGVLVKDSGWLLIYWEITDGARSAALRELGAEGAQARLVIRIDPIESSAPTDIDIDWNHGRRYVRAPGPGSRLRAQVGLLSPSGRFASLAESSPLRVPRLEPGPWEPVEWMEVDPARKRGLEFEPVQINPRAPGNPAGFRATKLGSTSHTLVGATSPWIRWPSSRRGNKPEGGS